jgi:hypothetical protein
VQIEELSYVRDEILRLRVELKAFRSKGATIMTALRIEVPKPNTYGRATKVREIENFLYGLERYFDTLGILDDAAKLQKTPVISKRYSIDIVETNER